MGGCSSDSGSGSGSGLVMEKVCGEDGQKSESSEILQSVCCVGVTQSLRSFAAISASSNLTISWSSNSSFVGKVELIGQQHQGSG